MVPKNLRAWRQHNSYGTSFSKYDQLWLLVVDGKTAKAIDLATRCETSTVYVKNIDRIHKSTCSRNWCEDKPWQNQAPGSIRTVTVIQKTSIVKDHGQVIVSHLQNCIKNYSRMFSTHLNSAKRQKQSWEIDASSLRSAERRFHTLADQHVLPNWVQVPMLRVYL